MESFNGSEDRKRLIDVKPFQMMPPSTLPLLAPTSFQVWKKPYYMKNSSSSTTSGTKNPLKSFTIDSLESDRNSTNHDIVASGGDRNLSNIDEKEAGVHGRLGRDLDPNMDPKKLKRIISNRVSAQKSRMKKLHYVTEMERKAKALENKIAVLHPQVMMYRNQQHLLQMEQKRLSQEMSARATTKILKDAEIEENKAEVNRLRQLHLTQQHQKMQEHLMVNAWKMQMMNSNLTQSDTEQTLFMNSNSAQIGEMNEEEMDEVNQQPVGQMWMVNPTNGSTMLQQKLIGAKANPNHGGIEQMLNFNQNNHSCVM
ncbi:hypothetical protein JCGZ_17376 [Jatropha curcas]|uniref:BZIP domain-containing protein n=1 Tax=Jatropha curcas TaxID=180498 RepID=A0A067LMX8_JATCU|nr:basic leucine zipper 34 [Jatropha curcas]KDP45769.1 hypothetical protein JCGZ_17376 [Jatropha curcas]